MRMLELFCGTKSITKAFAKRGFVTMTLDSEPGFEADICFDILRWEYLLEPNYGDLKYDVIWASPPCTAFSVASCGTHWGGGPRAYQPITETAKTGIAMVQRTLDILEYLKPEYWFIENPRGVLRKLLMMQNLKRTTVWYCKYGDNRAKPTDIWYKKWPRNMPIRTCRNNRPGQVRECHHELAPRGAKTGTQGRKTALDRARIPAGFCSLLAGSIKTELDYHDSLEKLQGTRTKPL